MNNITKMHSSYLIISNVKENFQSTMTFLTLSYLLISLMTCMLDHAGSYIRIYI